ncbi:MAG: hypothetical protein C4525_01885 [Desulfarculus sp.]|nr:MAG: hypothetical protein C4525_01885 [Desulfarculus sp.]
MQKDFHYCAIATLARATGFSPEDAQVIAYASQFADDSQDDAPLTMTGDQEFTPQATAHFGFASWAEETCRQVYVPFHFLPPQATPSGRAQFITRPDSALAQELVALAASHPDRLDRLVGLGLALHTYADTWAHQGFCGWTDPLNKVAGMFELDENGVPGQALSGLWLGTVGHIQARSNPDLPYLRWRYLAGQGGEEVRRDNQAEFLTAARRIHELLRRASGAPGRPWREIAGQVAGLIAVDSEDEEERCGAWQHSFASSLEGEWGYDSSAWRRQAIERDDSLDANWGEDSPTAPEPVHVWRGDPAKLPWAAFHRVARRQRAWVQERVPG